MKRLLFIFMLLLATQCLSAQDGLGALRELCRAGESVKVTGDIAAEGVVISDWSDVNPENGRFCAYIQNPDGSFGVRLLFDNPSENALRMGDFIRLSLRNCTLERSVAPDAVTIRGVRARAIDLLSRTEIKPVEVEADKVSDENLYTLVTLKNVDVVFKEGSWTNVHEEMVLAGDSAPCLLRSASGRVLYLLTDIASPWRRTGYQLPAGQIDITGILTHESLGRYAGDMGRYTIRPKDGKAVINVARKSLWKTLTGWEIPSFNGDELTFEAFGTVKGLFKTPKSGDRIASDCGSVKGWLWTDTGADIQVFSGYTATGTEKNGFSWGDAVMFSCPASRWYEWNEEGAVEDSRAFYMEFSASKLRTDCAMLTLEWSAGTQSREKCLYYPDLWKIECSTDGSTWTLLPEIATGKETFELRTVPYKGFRSNPVTSLGPQQHAFALPKAIQGVAKVLVRISPASLPDNIDKNTKQISYIRFESIKIEYR